MCISVHNEQYFHIADDTNPTRSLTLKNKNDCPFIIRPPRGQTLDLLPKSGMQKIFDSLEKCTRLRKNSLKRGKNRRIFGDNEPPMYCCAGLQASRTGGVDDHPAYLSSLSGTDWCSIMKMMHWAENCFESILDYIFFHTYGQPGQQFLSRQCQLQSTNLKTANHLLRQNISAVLHLDAMCIYNVTAIRTSH